jgi:acyl carrier protein
MSKNSFKDKLKEIFIQELKIKVNEKNKINDFEEWDSLANFNILLSCEKNFKVKFSPKEFNKLNSFKEILKVVKYKKELK